MNLLVYAAMEHRFDSAEDFACPKVKNPTLMMSQRDARRVGKLFRRSASAGNPGHLLTLTTKYRNVPSTAVN